MNDQRIVLISNTEYSNLGIGYISASLKRAGFKTRIIDSRKTNSAILRMVKDINPIMTGFSVTSHFNTIDRFIEIAGLLRKQGITCHFTAGGHYASLNPEELFYLIPGINSIVMFEGEYTVVELAENLKSGSDWRKIKGIAFRGKDSIVINQYRPLEKELDKFPYPSRTSPHKFGLEVPSSTLLAGRGCVNTCTFCNEGLFYKVPGGPLKRMRKPEHVVDEMKMLYDRENCLIFLFADDDFPIESRWSDKFCHELSRKQFGRDILWKMSCRADEITEKRFAFLKKHGLFLVFVGLEDGTDAGLLKLNKKITASRNLASINILKKLEIGIEIGFLLFQPESTYMSICENLDFLSKISGDGYFPITFSKLFPFYGTLVEADLRSSGRLKKQYARLDYDFREKWLDDYYLFTSKCFGTWLRSEEGLENRTMWINNSFMVYRKYYSDDRHYRQLLGRFRKIVSESNNFILNTMKELASYFETGQYLNGGEKKLLQYEAKISETHDNFIGRIKKIMGELYVASVEVSYRRLMA